jgi:hypothetical protein
MDSVAASETILLMPTLPDIRHLEPLKYATVFANSSTKLGPTAAEELLEIVMRRYERVSTLVTSNRPVEDWGKLLGDSAAVTAMLDRLLHHGHILKLRTAELEDQVAGGTMSPAPKTSRKATT